MTTTKRFIYLLLIATLASCQDLIVEDISEETVHILVPQDNVSTMSSTVTFAWEKIEDADSYQIQIVSPDFATAQTLCYDSVTENNKITFSLNPGKFEWRVKAINDISETKYTKHKLVIDSTLDLSSEKILLYTPIEGATLGSDSITFRWNKLYNADNYKFTLANTNNETLAEKLLTVSEYGIKVPADGMYQWSVRASNANTSTQTFSATFTIDTKAPEASLMKTPTNQQTILSDSVTFSWTTLQDAGSEVFDSLVVAHDSALSDKVLAIKTTGSSYSDTLSTGTYFWTVISIDKAGNKCVNNSVYTFVKE